ncbi:DNA polymerase III subunit chi [Aliidongia dinghuensis]|uniref:DNA polymerase III subunit chi n=1 Tax=Aliidongia dinghuensis TaxID=1867774 RepID=A0A8J2YV09_9PROT|nr:DNA polymerase III subunit chi [Aliidongia dinghuensis]GGF25288.1 DNA polymerase III subunit chi [Aliidongia dinghuensis]
MTEIGFYHLQRSPLGEALPRLLEKALAAGLRVLVRVPNEAEVERLVVQLWTYDAGTFLPHGSARDGRSADQPIYLTAADENPNGAELLAQVGGAEMSDVGPFKRCLDLFDGGDDDQVSAARTRWKRYQAEGHQLTYWQQKPSGGWERKA